MPGGTLSAAECAQDKPVVPVSRKTPAAEGVDWPRTRTRPSGLEYPKGASLLMAAKRGPVLSKISEGEGFKMARSARHKRDRKRDIKRGFLPMPRKKNAQNPRERIRPYRDTDQNEERAW